MRGIDAGNYVDDDYPEEAPEVTGQELMEIDGTWLQNRFALRVGTGADTRDR